jgi:hypothetical protein
LWYEQTPTGLMLGVTNNPVGTLLSGLFWFGATGGCEEEAFWGCDDDDDDDDDDEEFC